MSDTKTFRLAVLIAAVVASVATFAQQIPAPAPPATEVYLAELSSDGQRVPGAGAINISNNPDYDNQPSFAEVTGQASVLFSSKRDGKQTDIYHYEIAAKKLTQLTHTAESEYSPLVMPDGKTFSVVRVEADNTQRLWRFDWTGSNPQLVLENIKPVGYHAWMTQTHLGLFVLGAQGQPNTLQLANTTTGKAEVVASNIGRGLLMSAAHDLTFVSKQTTPWIIKAFDPASKEIKDLAPVLDGAEDFVWLDIRASSRLLMARGSKIFMWLPDTKEWHEQADFAADGVARITRLAVSPVDPRSPIRHLAFVAEPAAK